MSIEKNRRPLNAPMLQTFRKVTLTNAQVLALFTTPIIIVPARTGYINVFEGAILQKPAGTAYTVGTGGNIVISYTNAAGLSVGEQAPAGFADQSTLQTREVRKLAAASGGSGIAVVADAALVIHQLTANMTAGTSPIKVQVFYKQVPKTL